MTFFGYTREILKTFAGVYITQTTTRAIQVEYVPTSPQRFPCLILR